MVWQFSWVLDQCLSDNQYLEISSFSCFLFVLHFPPFSPQSEAKRGKTGKQDFDSQKYPFAGQNTQQTDAASFSWHSARGLLAYQRLQLQAGS